MKALVYILASLLFIICICDGSSMESIKCKESKCDPIDGKWSNWSSWSTCNAACDGTRSRRRFCDSPIPENEGKYCDGASSEKELCSASDNCKQSNNKVFVGYYPSWGIYDRKFFVQDIDWNRLTHVVYAFLNIKNGRCVLGDPWADVQKIFSGDQKNDPVQGNVRQLQKQKQKYPDVKVLLSVGGWSWSKHFSTVAQPENRQVFVTSCVNLVTQYGFDGIDVDWEYPVRGGNIGNIESPSDKDNHFELMKAFKDSFMLLPNGKDYQVTIAAGATPKRIEDLRVADLNNVLSYIFLMCYDYHGGWGLQATGHNSPLYRSPKETEYFSLFNTESSVTGYISAGLDRSKLVVGVPFYGRGWSGVEPGDDLKLPGLGQPATGVPPGTWEDGLFDYKDLKDNYVGKNGFQEYCDDVAEACYLYSHTEKVFITYDSPKIMRKKANYIISQKLAGTKVWEMSADKENELQKTLFDILSSDSVDVE